MVNSSEQSRHNGTNDSITMIQASKASLTGTNSSIYNQTKSIEQKKEELTLDLGSPGGHSMHVNPNESINMTSNNNNIIWSHLNILNIYFKFILKF